MLRRMYSSAILFFMLIAAMIPTTTPAGALPANDAPPGTTSGHQSQSVVSHWEGTLSPDPLSLSDENASSALSSNTFSFDLTYDENGVPTQLTYQANAIHATIDGEGNVVCYNGWPATLQSNADFVGAMLPGFYVQDHKWVSTTDFFRSFGIQGVSGRGTGLPGDIGLENAEGQLLLYYNYPSGTWTCNWAWQAACTSNCPAGPTWLAFSQTTYEVREDAGPATVTVVRTGNSENEVTVDYSTSDGTASAYEDYFPRSDVALTFPSGHLQKTVDLTIVKDTLSEGLESFNVTLSNPTNGAELGTQSTAQVIIDDRTACYGVPTHCLPMPFYCPAPAAGCWQIGYGRTRNFVQAEGWGDLDNADDTFVDSCTIVRDFETCLDEIVMCTYRCVPAPPPPTTYPEPPPPTEPPSSPPPPTTPPTPPITITQPLDAQADLGDAPDSSNTSSQPMTAYPSINAQFPTVKGAASPYGPKHDNALPMAGWLGPEISAEDEADTGADADPTNNLIPPSDTADQDMADDGLALPIPISHCVSSPLQFAVAIPESAPAGVEWKVNVWFDWNRDGKWGDVLTCGSDPAPEWAVQNLSLGELDPGYHILYASILPYNPEPVQPMWMRITLSDESASSADGSGPAAGYQYGETEDYFLLASDLQPWSSSAIAPGATYTRTFSQTGNYPYHDQQIPNNWGLIRVAPKTTTQLQRPSAVAEVHLTDTGFDPLGTIIAVGDSVRWHNDTTTTHTIVSSVLSTDTDPERVYLPLVVRNSALSSIR